MSQIWSWKTNSVCLHTFKRILLDLELRWFSKAQSKVRCITEGCTSFLKFYKTIVICLNDGTLSGMSNQKSCYLWEWGISFCIDFSRGTRSLSLQFHCQKKLSCSQMYNVSCPAYLNPTIILYVPLQTVILIDSSILWYHLSIQSTSHFFCLHKMWYDDTIYISFHV